MERPRPDPEALLAHEAFLRAIARPLVRDESGVDDVVQETWLTALRKQPRDASRLRQWLGAVARNLALRTRRADERRVRREQAVAKREDDDVVARVARHQKIVDSVLGLEEPYRTAVLLRFYDGLSSDEIGARSGVTGAAVRKRISKALDLLRARLDELHGGDRGAWSVVLLPLVVAPRLKPVALVGGIVMGTKVKLGLAAVLMLTLVGTVWTLTRPPDAPARSDSTAMPAGPTGEVATAVAPSDALPPPIDFSLVDRDRDVHGVVVSRDGSPVASAVVQAVSFPWRRIDEVGFERALAAEAGAQTRTAGDGTFAIRLAWGEAVHLRATAAGFATSDTSLVQAGERTRIVLVPPERLTVRVRDESGRDVEGARAELAIGDPEDIGLAISRQQAVTGADGTLAFEGIPVDVRASLTVTHERLVRVARWIEPGEQGIDITMEAGLTVGGRVLESGTLEPVSGAVVDTLPGGPKETRTGSDGRYVLRGLSRVGSVIQATAEGHVGAGVHIYRDDPLCYQDVRIHLNYEQQRHVENAREVDLLLPRASVVTGRVVDHTGAPVPGALLAAGWPVLLPACGVSDPRGLFRLEGPWHGAGDKGDTRHRLAVFAKGHGRALVPFDATNLDLGEVVLPASGAIEGRVLTPQGDPVPRASVHLQKELAESRRTDDLGRFRFPDLEPGTYMLSTQPEGASALVRNVELAPGGRVVADMQFGKWVPFDVHVVTEAGEPVVGATVRVATGFRDSKAATGPDGRATVNVAGTPRFASVEPPAAKGSSRYRGAPLLELKGGEREATFVLAVEGVVRGRVEGPEGAPVAMSELKVRHGGHLVDAGSTGPDGTFEVQVPAEGECDLVLTGRSLDARPSHGPPRLLRGELRGIRAGAESLLLKATAIEAPRTLRVRLLDPDGKGPVYANVAALPSARPFVQTHWSEGVAELQGLPDEDVTVTVSASHWFWLPPEPVRVVPAGQELTLRFREAVVAGGRVLMPDGSAAEGAIVEALRGEELLSSTAAGPDGRFGFAFDPLTRGPLRFRARFDPLTDGEYEGAVDGVMPAVARLGYSSVDITLAAVR